MKNIRRSVERGEAPQYRTCCFLEPRGIYLLHQLRACSVSRNLNRGSSKNWCNFKFVALVVQWNRISGRKIKSHNCKLVRKYSLVSKLKVVVRIILKHLFQCSTHGRFTMFGQCINGDKTGLTRAIKNKAGRTIDKKTRQKKFLKSQTDGEGKVRSLSILEQQRK